LAAEGEEHLKKKKKKKKKKNDKGKKVMLGALNVDVLGEQSEPALVEVRLGRLWFVC
jgi:hypothetical protein